MSKKCKEIRNRFDNTTIMKILGENTSPVVDSEVLLSGGRGGGRGDGRELLLPTINFEKYELSFVFRAEILQIKYVSIRNWLACFFFKFLISCLEPTHASFHSLLP